MNVSNVGASTCDRSHPPFCPSLFSCFSIQGFTRVHRGTALKPPRFRRCPPSATRGPSLGSRGRRISGEQERPNADPPAPEKGEARKGERRKGHFLSHLGVTEKCYKRAFSKVIFTIGPPFVIPFFLAGEKQADPQKIRSWR